MIYLIVKLFPKAETREEFDALMKEMIVKSNEEDACIQYVLTSTGEEEGLYLLEAWASKEGLEFHTKTDHYLNVLPKVLKLCSKEAEFTRLKDIYEA